MSPTARASRSLRVFRLGRARPSLRTAPCPQWRSAGACARGAARGSAGSGGARSDHIEVVIPHHQRVGTGVHGGDSPDREEPQEQRLARVLEDPLAASLTRYPGATQAHTARVVAYRSPPSVSMGRDLLGPSRLTQMGSAATARERPPLESRQRPKEVRYPLRHPMLRSLDTHEYPHRSPTIPWKLSCRHSASSL